MARAKPVDLVEELLESFDHALRVSEYLVGEIPDAAWRAEPAGGKGRTVAAIPAHMQSVRRTIGKVAAGHAPPPTGGLGAGA